MIGFSLFMWAWQVEPRRVETVTAAMEMPQWKRKEGPPLRIAIAGDFHLRPNGGDLAHKYMETIMEARPDMIFLLGDYANGHTRESSMASVRSRLVICFLMSFFLLVGLSGLGWPGGWFIGCLGFAWAALLR